MNTDEFLNMFFKPPNLFHIDEIRKAHHDAYQFIAKSIDYLKQEEPLFTVLPYCVDKNQPVYWFGIALNNDQAAEMRGYLKAFVGKTYSNLSANRIMNTDKIVGKAVKDYVKGDYGLVFQGKFKEVENALKFMYEVRSKRPLKKVRDHTSTGDLIRSFHYALKSHDEQEAIRLVEMMKSRKFLDATNLIFLDVQIKANFQRWEDLYHHKYFDNLLAIRRPKVVTMYLLQSVYEVLIKKQYEERMDAEGAVCFFKYQVLPHVQPLFNTIIQANTLELLKIQLLELLSFDQIEPGSWSQLSLQATKLVPSDDFWQKLVEIKNKKEVPSSIPDEDPHMLMMLAFKEGNFKAAKEYSFSVPSSSDKALVLFSCALTSNDFDSYNLHVQIMNDLSVADQQLVNDKINKTLNFISSQQSWLVKDEVLPENWLGLLKKVNTDETFARLQAIQIAEELAVNLSDNTFKDQIFIDQLIDALTAARSEQSEKVLKRLLPHLISSLYKSETSSVLLHPVYNALFDLLVTTNDLNRGELITINDLVDVILMEGVNKARYQEIINGIIGIKQYYHSLYTIDCLVDFADIILQYDLKLIGELAMLLNEIKVILEQVSKLHDVDEQRQLFNSFCSYLNLNDLRFATVNETFEDQNAIWNFYQNKKIGIYTLTENASKRAVTFLNYLQLNIKMNVNNDHVGTPALKDLAINSDILIIVTGSAKHAATDYIKQYRQNKKVLYPNGKGSSSILSILKTFAIQNKS